MSAMTIFPKCYFEGGENMKKVSCTVMIHDNVDILPSKSISPLQHAEPTS